MLLSHNPKFIFIHVPNTAGNSICHALQNAIPDCLAYYPNTNYTHKHGTVRDALQAIPDFDDYYSFGFARNPWERIYFFYKYLAPLIKIEFDEFLINDRYRDFGSCASVMLSGVKFIGRYENLENDFKIVCQALGIEAKLEQTVAVDVGDYREHYSEIGRAIITERYQQDIEMFGYEF